MNVLTLMQGVGSIGLFSSRAFLTAFVTAFAMRFGPDVPMFQDAEFLQGLHGAPTWFTHDTTLLVLGLLALVEMLADKSPEARFLLAEFDRYLKPAMAGLTYVGVVGTADVAFVDRAVSQAGVVDYILTLVIIPGVYLLSSARAQVLSLLSESDEDDDIGIQKLISWAEDLGVLGGLVLLIAFPVVMLILLAMVAGMLLLAQKRAQVREEKSKVPCASCGQMIYPSAVACPSCDTKVSAPRAVGVFGQSKPKPAGDLVAHAYRLVEKKRCCVCATRMTKRMVPQDCPACGHKVLADADFANAYMAYVGRRLPVVCVVSLLLSLIPVVGLVPGVIYYRVTLVAPFRRYLPLGRRILLKWLTRLFFFFLIAIQWVPLLGGVVVPVMALVNYGAYRSAFRSQLQRV